MLYLSKHAAVIIRYLRFPLGGHGFMFDWTVLNISTYYCPSKALNMSILTVSGGEGAAPCCAKQALMFSLGISLFSKNIIYLSKHAAVVIRY